ncbi:MAG: pyridoxamine 5'-phosphate oxidase family protein [Kiritimatiellae bacterium]|nr:pyridoxamine 5'-phosphate oxidase family protein [Kiritimatiellia bacterium]
MATLPETVSKAWENIEGPIVLTTVDKDGSPNSIYATCIKKFSEDKLVVADNYFSKTRANILDGSKGSILFLTKEGKAFQVKGSISYEKEGEVFDDMKIWNDTKHPGHAATILNVEEVYAGADKLL